MAQFKEKWVSVSGQSFVLRPVQVYEAQHLMASLVELTREAPFLLSTSEELQKITVEKEEAWIDSHNRNENGFLAAADIDGKVVGLINFLPLSGVKRSHRGSLALTLHPQFRGRGLGRRMMEFLLEFLSTRSSIEWIELTVMEENQRAVNLYLSLGFEIIARIPDSFRLPADEGISPQTEIFMRKRNQLKRARD